MATQKELLIVAKAVDSAEFAVRQRVVRAMKEASQVPTSQPHPIEDLKLVEDDADPFNGNLNNRRVAARIAAKRDVYIGDPEKAAKDVAQSLKVLPEPEVPTGDELPPVKLAAKPTPGSPAANKEKAGKVTQMPAAETQEAATGTEDTAASVAPPQWKANA